MDSGGNVWFGLALSILSNDDFFKAFPNQIRLRFEKETQAVGERWGSIAFVEVTEQGRIVAVLAIFAFFLL